MERRVRYEVLTNEDDDSLSLDAEPATLHVVGPPPEECGIPQDAAAAAAQDTWSLEKEMGKQEPQMPPSYNVATSLPSYEEAERSKQEEIRDQEQEQQQQGGQQAGGRDVDRFTEMQLGTDGMFLCMFIIAFLFNWIGLLASLCLTHTVAGRFGAIAGFGLSMVKWVAIVKLSLQTQNWAAGVADGDSWLWWLLIILGFLIFFRGCTQYIRLKYQWHLLNVHMRNRVYFLF